MTFTPIRSLVQFWIPGFVCLRGGQLSAFWRLTIESSRTQEHAKERSASLHCTQPHSASRTVAYRGFVSSSSSSSIVRSGEEDGENEESEEAREETAAVESKPEPAPAAKPERQETPTPAAAKAGPSHLPIPTPTTSLPIPTPGTPCPACAVVRACVSVRCVCDLVDCKLTGWPNFSFEQRPHKRSSPQARLCLRP